MHWRLVCSCAGLDWFFEPRDTLFASEGVALAPKSRLEIGEKRSWLSVGFFFIFEFGPVSCSTTVVYCAGLCVIQVPTCLISNCNSTAQSMH